MYAQVILFRCQLIDPMIIQFLMNLFVRNYNLININLWYLKIIECTTTLLYITIEFFFTRFKDVVSLNFRFWSGSGLWFLSTFRKIFQFTKVLLSFTFIEVSMIVVQSVPESFLDQILDLTEEHQHSLPFDSEPYRTYRSLRQPSLHQQRFLSHPSSQHTSSPLQ